MKNLALAWMCAAFLIAGSGCKNASVLTSGKPDGGGSGKEDSALPWVWPVDATSRDLGFAPTDAACSRSVNLKGVTIARPVPFDVIIVSDNSDSLSWSRDSLSAGFENLLARVRGHEARFFVLTTTQYGASSQAAVSPLTGKELVSWQDSVSGAAYLNAMTTYNQTCVDGSGASRACPTAPPDTAESWKVTGTWQFRMPPPIAAITPAMDAAQITAEQRRLADAILALGGGGSQQEQPLCTLLRYIGQDPTALPKHAIFVVLSDEDDTSPPEACLAGYQAIHEAGLSSSKVACQSDCPEYVYMVNRANQEERLDFTCLPVDDKGTPHPEQATQKTLVAKTGALCSADGGSTSLACTDAELSKAAGECGAGNVVRNCTHTCGDSKSYVQCNLSRSDNKTNLCTQPFDQNGTRYANLTEYCSRTTGRTTWQTCSVMGLKPSTADGGTTTSRSERTTPVVPVTSTSDMIQSFRNGADRLIGQGNYSVEAIILDPAFDCPLHSGQSYAPNLRSLASSARDVFPLCKDYAPAIEGIVSFAEYLIQTTYSLYLDEYEDVDSVLVKNRQGVERTVPADGYAYDRGERVLRFRPGVLTAQDETLAVNVARYCEPIIF